MPDAINSLGDLRPGDIMLCNQAPGPARVLVTIGQWLCGDNFIVGYFNAGHAGIVTRAADPGGWPHLVQAMPHGAEEIALTARHWAPGYAYVRLPEDYPGQATDAAAVALEMVGTPYSFASYLALAAWSRGIKARNLERWIDRRTPPVQIRGVRTPRGRRGDFMVPGLPVEAICSVLVDQAWSLAGKRVCEGVAHQAVTPGRLARSLFENPDAVWHFC